MISRLPNKDRVEAALSAINAVGGASIEDEPGEADIEFATDVSTWQAHTGVSHHNAVIFSALTRQTEPSDPMRTLLDAIARGETVSGKDAKSRWLATLAQQLAGSGKQ
jgi:hypothetical protein